MKEHLFKKEETPIKFQQKTHLNILTKDHQNSENIFTEQNLLGLSKSKVINMDENINTKITQVSLKEMQNNQNFQNLIKNPFINNSSPKLKNSKDLFSRIDNSPIKNMDLSPFKNLNYLKNSENCNQINCVNTNVKVNLNSKLENISKGLNLIENKNIINHQNSNIKKNESLNVSPKFFDVKYENKAIDMNNTNNEKNKTNDYRNLINTNITKNNVFPDTNHGIFLNLINKTNADFDASNNYINTLSINNVNINNYNHNPEKNNMIPGNSSVSFTQINISNRNNYANDDLNNSTSKQFNIFKQNSNQQQSFSNIPNPLNIKPFEIDSNTDLINNNKNLIGFNSNLGFNAMPNQNYHHYYKGNISIYSRESEIDITRNPFENKIKKQESINPFKRSIAREHLDKFEKDNELFVNNQLNYRGQHVHLIASAKPSLSLIESRNRLGIFSKVFQEDKFKNEDIYEDNYNNQKVEKSCLLTNNIENTNKNPFNNKYNFDKSAFSNLKSKNKKADSVENNIEIISEKSENITPNEKLENYKFHDGKNNSNNLINTKVNSIDEESEYLKKLKKLEETEKFYEMIEEFEDESKIEDENSFCFSMKKEYMSSSINGIINKTEKARYEDSNDNFKKNDNSSYKNIKNKDSEDESDKRKKLPENVNVFQLIQQYPELYILCRKINTNDKNEKVEFDAEKFKRLVEEEMNLLIPLNKKNDEVFKRKIIAKKMLNEKLSENQSAKRSDTYYSKPPQQILDNEITYYTMKKKRFSHSAKKLYSSVIQLSDFKKKLEKYFTIFRDADIGITEYWQVSMIESREDEDVETDDDSCKRAQTFCLLEIREAIGYYNHQSKDKRDDLFENKIYMTLPNGELKYP